MLSSSDESATIQRDLEQILIAPFAREHMTPAQRHSLETMFSALMSAELDVHADSRSPTAPGALPGPGAVTAAGLFRSGRAAAVDMYPRYHISHRETGLRQAGET